MHIETESIDKLFLELAQITKARTPREIGLEKEVSELRAKLQPKEAMNTALEWLERANRDAAMEDSNFDLLWPDPKNDPLPQNEKEVTDFIRRRTRLWRQSWVLGPIREAMKALREAGATR